VVLELYPEGTQRHRMSRRIPLNTRTTPTLRSRLEEAATASGRSLAQEVEARLLGSFSLEDTVRVIRETVRQEMRAEFEARNRHFQPMTREPGRPKDHEFAMLDAIAERQKANYSRRSTDAER
jgi:TraY domain